MQNNATILIPDISGYTEFFSRTDIEFSTAVLCELLNELIRVADDDFKVAEIEGDAILFYIKAKKLDADALVKYCLRAYTHFHKYLLKIVSRVEDPEARAAAERLTIKFIAHWGPIAEINIANFSKPVGMALIKAHKLLKNRIESGSYILLTHEFCKGQELPEQTDIWPEPLVWQHGCEEYPVIGEVKHCYFLLEPVQESKKDPHTT